MLPKLLPITAGFALALSLMAVPLAAQIQQAPVMPPPPDQSKRQIPITKQQQEEILKQQDSNSLLPRLRLRPRPCACA